MTNDEHKKPKKHNSHHTTHKKVFDITRPGKAPASPNSRSVIASQEPPVPDDQFVPSAPPLRASDPYAKHDLMNPKNKKDLQPMNSADNLEQAEPITTSVAGAGAPALPTQPEYAPATPAPLITDQPAASATASEANTTTPGSEDRGEETPAHLAMEQTVATGDDTSGVPIWEHPDTSQQVEGSTQRRAATAGSDTLDKNKSIEDLLAETGAPILEPEQSPSLIVSHHDAHHGAWWKIMLILLSIVALAAIALNLLLDAEIITMGLDLPHTDLF